MSTEWTVITPDESVTLWDDGDTIWDPATLPSGVLSDRSGTRWDPVPTGTIWTPIV